VRHWGRQRMRVGEDQGSIGIKRRSRCGQHPNEAVSTPAERKVCEGCAGVRLEWRSRRRHCDRFNTLAWRSSAWAAPRGALRGSGNPHRCPVSRLCAQRRPPTAKPQKQRPLEVTTGQFHSANLNLLSNANFALFYRCTSAKYRGGVPVPDPLFSLSDTPHILL
jgi:hypothetical protein